MRKLLRSLINRFISKLAKEIALECRKLELFERWANSHQAVIHRERAIAALSQKELPTAQEIYKTFNAQG